MSKYSSFKTQQLLVEGWRTFMIEQQPINQQSQQVAKPQLTPQNIKQSIVDLARQPVKEKGPNQQTKKMFNDPKILAQLQQLVKSGKIVDAINFFKQNVTGDDFIEIAQIETQIEKAASSSVKEQKMMRGKSSRPIASAIEAASGLAEKGLTTLGGGDIVKGLNKFAGYSAFTVLSGMILANLLQAATTKNPASLKDAIELIPHLKNSLTLSNSGQLAQFIQDTGQQMTSQIAENTQYHGAHLDDGTLVCEACLEELLESQRTIIQEAKYQGRTVTLNKPFLTPDGPKKRSVYVKDPKTGNVKKVNFGDKNLRIKKSNPKRRKSFRARHKCHQKKDKTTSGYWSCKFWE